MAIGQTPPDIGMLMTPDRRPMIIDRGMRPPFCVEVPYNYGPMARASFYRIWKRNLPNLLIHRHRMSPEFLKDCRSFKDFKKLQDIVNSSAKERLLSGMKTR